MKRLLLAATVGLLCTTSFAQDPDISYDAPTPRYAGVYRVATHTFIPASQLPASSFVDLNNQIIYNANCSPASFLSLLNNSVAIDDGRVPAINTPAPNAGTRSSYRVNKFEIAYVTRDVAGATMRIRFWNDYNDCDSLALAGTPTADFTVTGPGATTQGVAVGFILTIDLTGFEFCLSSEANGTFDNSDLLDGFGYGLTMLNQVGTTTATVGGFFLAGQPTSCANGNGTYYKLPGSPTGTGLGNNDLYRRDGAGGQTSGCLFFGGNPYAGFYMRLWADLDSCTCTPNNFDNDGALDCVDGCPADAGKTVPGVCGCGIPDTDTDGDGTPNCIDGCPNDPNKIASGICGCGVADTDSDGDGAADCNDVCPNDPNKIASAGQCGCGNPETDSDGDGTADCVDACPNDPNKTVSAGQCGCGNPETDTDGDGTADCVDACPNDPNKAASSGQCGCGNPDTDTDGDGTADCNDACPTDPNKILGGTCGCGVPETDTDGDGIVDCIDACPTDPNKTVSAGQCGCGNPETDTDGDGVADCVDNCDALANPGQEDCNGNGIGDVCDLASGYSLDANTNGVPDDCEQGVGVPFCFGDGSGTPCPCGNAGDPGHGCANSATAGALLYNLGGASVGGGNTDLYSIRLPSGMFGLFYMGTNPMAGGNGVMSYDGLRCVNGFTKRYALQNSGAGGVFHLANPAALQPTLVLAGTTWFFQANYRDNSGSPCSNFANYTNALRIDFLP
ncbi:MAG: thrombospondin type 3 repeat-containing protein [Planctomycetes bacterium]|nr:thrombospondin type 3 repeat-containing protein [Planctomycetota bacterium]